MTDREDMEALAEELRPPGPDTEPGLTFRRVIAQRVLASEWFAAYVAARVADALAPIEAIHYRVAPEHVAGPGWCHSCPTEWPCPTIRALHPTDGA